MHRTLLSIGLAVAATLGLNAVRAGADGIAAEVPVTHAIARMDELYATMQCRDKRGHDIALVKVVNLGDIGRAWYMNRVPVIAMDPHLADRLPEKFVRFFYDHECAHHVLGHWFFVAPDRENDADCWAITRARDAGRLVRDDILAFAPFLAKSGGSAAGHLPGPERVRHLLFCFDKPLGG